MTTCQWTCLTLSVLLAAACAHADTIRVGSEWHQDVYVIESGQFYQILFPETGDTERVSKKRQDVSAPRFTKDPDERAALKARWEEASERGTRVQSRQAEIRRGSRQITNLDEQGRPVVTSRPSPELELTPEQWAERMQRVMENPAPPMEQNDAEPVPPGPRESPEPGMPEGEAPAEQRSGPTQEALREMMQDENFMAEIERLMVEPYYYSDEEREVLEELRRTAMERMQGEAYYWDALRSQGYMDAQPYVESGGGATSHSAQSGQY